MMHRKAMHACLGSALNVQLEYSAAHLKSIEVDSLLIAYIKFK